MSGSGLVPRCDSCGSDRDVRVVYAKTTDAGGEVSWAECRDCREHALFSADVADNKEKGSC